MKKQKFIAKINSEIDDLRNKYGPFVLRQNDDICIIAGNLTFVGSYKDEDLFGEFDIEIHVTSDYPISPPMVREVSGKISYSFHRYSSGFLCLGFPPAVSRKFSKRPNLLGFVEDLVVPYLYSFVYYQKFNKMPFGELSHYELGIFEFYMESFAVYEKEAILSFLKILSGQCDDLIIPCPCKSGQAFLSCHGNVLSELKKFRTVEEFEDDYKKLADFLDNDAVKLQNNTKLFKKYRLL